MKNEDLSQAEKDRLNIIITKSFIESLEKIEKKYPRKQASLILPGLTKQRELFITHLLRHCDKVINAAKEKPAIHKLVSDFDLYVKELKHKRKLARQEMSANLTNARQRLRSLNWKIENAEKVAHAKVEKAAREKRQEMSQRLMSARHSLKTIKDAHKHYSNVWHKEHKVEHSLNACYPDIPEPIYSPNKDGLGLPDCPGIYFIWSNDKVDYVGQSIHLNIRLKLGSHHILKEDHKIAILLFDKKELDWAECYYIGITRPYYNFGKSASHYESDSL